MTKHNLISQIVNTEKLIPYKGIEDAGVLKTLLLVISESVLVYASKCNEFTNEEIEELSISQKNFYLDESFIISTN